MSRFDNRTLDKSINAAIVISNNLLGPSSEMLHDISNKDNFKYNSGIGNINHES